MPQFLGRRVLYIGNRHDHASNGGIGNAGSDDLG
jgi:hypothetical protein